MEPSSASAIPLSTIIAQDLFVSPEQAFKQQESRQQSKCARLDIAVSCSHLFACLATMAAEAIEHRKWDRQVSESYSHCQRKRNVRGLHLGLLLLVGCLGCDSSTAFVAVDVRRAHGVSEPSSLRRGQQQRLPHWQDRPQEQPMSLINGFHHSRAAHSSDDDSTGDSVERDCDESLPSSSVSNHRRRGRLARWKTRGKRWVASMALAGTIMFGRTNANSNIAHAKFSHELSDDRTYSLRPGVNKEQAQLMMDGEMPEDAPQGKSILDKQGSPSTSSSASSADAAKKKEAQKKKSSTFDYGDEDEESDVLFLEDEESEYGQAVIAAGAPLKQSENNAAQALKARTKSEFTGIDTSKTKTKMMYVKVSIGFFVPTYGSLVVREWYRRRKEEVYVKKGLEVLEAQKKEFFGDDEEKDEEDGDGEGDDDDSDDDDDDDDDDEEDDDEDDDDEEDEPPKKPRKPRPPLPDLGGGGSSGGGDSGNGRASDDDVKRLGDLFNKS